MNNNKKNGGEKKKKNLHLSLNNHMLLEATLQHKARWWLCDLYSNMARQLTVIKTIKTGSG